MNYLAHFHLAQSDDELVIGALLGDFIKGPLQGVWPDGWERGIRLHRRIDAFSDQNPQRLHSAASLPPKFRRYAGIILDVYSDYWLSRHWTQFEQLPLEQFSARIYALLSEHMAQLPEAPAHMARRLIEHNVLGIFDRWETVVATLERIGTRLSRANPLALVATELAPYMAQLEQDFLAFYPQLTQQVKTQLRS